MTATPLWITSANLKGGCRKASSAICAARACSADSRAPLPDSGRAGAVAATLLGQGGGA